MWGWFLSAAHREQYRIAEAHYLKFKELERKNREMTCTCNKTTTPVKIDWTKPIQWNPWGNNPDYREEWKDAKVIGRISKTNLPVVETETGGLYAVTDKGEISKGVSGAVYVRNKPVQTKREWIDVEVYRSPNGLYSARVKKPDNSAICATHGIKVADTPVQVSYEIDAK